MAILEDVPGLEVRVQIGSKDATEYDERPATTQQPPGPDATCPTVTKYIECISDAEFGIKTIIGDEYEWGYRGHSLRTTIRIDNYPASGTIFTENSSRHHCEHVKRGKVAYCQQSRQWRRYKFRFSDVSTTDDCTKEQVAKDLQTARHLGLIQVSLSRCICQGSRPREKRPIKCDQKFELVEKSLKGKAISHGISYSPGEQVATREETITEGLPEDHGPIAVFRFLYRSRDALKQELIIPRSPSPPIALSIAKLPQARIECLAKERLEQLKREKIVKEHRSIVKRELGEVVDLTGYGEASHPTKRCFINLTNS
ncbi:hypothetical protein F5Y19DRAFT_466110 [Xylariaceae sp. FL1651]|nr:hypothetical protein F5Y19DRAFT_466110 [Xylariaceae sp. FL1651]